MNNKNIAVIGAGHLGKIHAKLLKTVPGVSPYVVETNREARAFVENELGIPTFETVDGISEKLHGAIVVTPTATHFEVGSRLIEKGCHLFVEKPICDDVESSKALCELAERNGVVLQVGHVERFNPAFVAAKPYLGNAQFIECNRLTPYTFRATDVSVVLDLMIHDIDLVLSTVKSPVVSVSATGNALIGPHHDLATAWLSFENGTKACLKASRCSSIANRSMNVFKKEGHVLIDFANQSVHEMKAVENIGQQLSVLTPDEIAVAKNEMFDKWLPEQEISFEPQNAILQEQMEFVQYINDEQFPTVSGRDGLAAVKVAEWILSEIDSTSVVQPKKVAA